MEELFKLKMKQYEQMFLDTDTMPRKKKKKERKIIRKLALSLIWVYTNATELGLTY